LKINNKTVLVYPHQLKISEKGKLKVVVIQSYFKGSHYLIEARYKQQSLFFENPTAFEKKEIIYLNFT
jgi:hypothetical protein